MISFMLLHCQSAFAWQCAEKTLWVQDSIHKGEDFNTMADVSLAVDARQPTSAFGYLQETRLKQQSVA